MRPESGVLSGWLRSFVWVGRGRNAAPTNASHFQCGGQHVRTIVMHVRASPSTSWLDDGACHEMFQMQKCVRCCTDVGCGCLQHIASRTFLRSLRAEIAAKANAMSGDLKAMLDALLAQLARLRAERERLEALIRAYEEAEMARLKQMIAELLAQLNKLKVRDPSPPKKNWHTECCSRLEIVCRCSICLPVLCYGRLH